MFNLQANKKDANSTIETKNEAPTHSPSVQNNISFEHYKVEQDTEGKLPDTIQQNDELDFGTFRIFNRYYPLYSPDCTVRVNEESIQIDSKVLSKLSPLLAAMIAAAKHSNSTGQLEINLSGTSPNVIRFLASFLSGDQDLPNLCTKADLELFSEIVSFAYAWQCRSLLNECDKHASRCLTEQRGVTGTVIGLAASAVTTLSSAPIIHRIIPIQIRNFCTNQIANNPRRLEEAAKFAWWANNHPQALTQLLRKLPGFHRTVCESASTCLQAHKIEIVPEPSNVYAASADDNYFLQNFSFDVTQHVSTEQQRQNASEYLHCVQRWTQNEELDSLLQEKDEPFLLGLLLHVVTYAPVNSDFSGFALALFSYLRDRFIENKLSKKTAQLVAELAQQNPAYANLIQNRHLTLEAQSIEIENLHDYLQTLEFSDNEQKQLWSVHLLKQRMLGAQAWAPSDWEKVPLLNLWQMFVAMSEDKNSSYQSMTECYQIVKQRLAESAAQENPPSWAQKGHILLSNIKGNLLSKSDNDGLYVSSIKQQQRVNVSSFFIAFHGEYTNLVNRYQNSELPSCECISWQSQNLQQLELLAYVLENGKFPDNLLLDELDLPSLQTDLQFLGCLELFEQLLQTLCNQVTVNNVAEYWLFAREYDCEALEQQCLKTINSSGFIRVSPLPNDTWDLEELKDFEKLSLAQRQVLNDLLTSNRWNVSIRSWSKNCSASKNIVNAVRKYERLALHIISSFTPSFTSNFLHKVNKATLNNHTIGVLNNYTYISLNIILLVFILPHYNDLFLKFNGLVPLAPEIKDTIFVIKDSRFVRKLYDLEEKSVNSLKSRVCKLFRMTSPIALQVNDQELSVIPVTNAPHNSKELACRLNKNVEILDLTNCSDQLTAKDLAWIAQRCPNLQELKLGITKELFGMDWLPLAKLSQLRRLEVFLKADANNEYGFSDSIDSLDLKELSIYWPHLEQITVTVDNEVYYIPPGRVFLSNCPKNVPLKVKISGPFSKQYFAHFSTLTSLEFNSSNLILLSEKNVEMLAKNCPLLQEIKNISLADDASRGLKLLAEHCDLRRIESLKGSNINNEAIQSIVHYRKEKLTSVSISLLSNDLTTTGLNCFAQCPNLKRLIVLNAHVSNNEGELQPLLTAPQIQFLSLPFSTGLSAQTRLSLSRRWIENLEQEHSTDIDYLKNMLIHFFKDDFTKIGDLTGEIYKSSTYIIKAKNTLPLIRTIQHFLPEEMDAVIGPFLNNIFGDEEPSQDVTQLPGSIFDGILAVWSLGQKLINIITYSEQFDLQNFPDARPITSRLTGFDPVVALHLLLQSLRIPEEAFKAYRNILHNFSLNNEGINHTLVSSVLEKWKKTIQSEFAFNGHLVKQELVSLLFSTQEQAVNMNRERLQEHFTMTLARAQSLFTQLFRDLNIVLGIDPRVEEKIIDARQKLAAAKQEAVLYQASLERMQANRGERVADQPAIEAEAKFLEFGSETVERYEELLNELEAEKDKTQPSSERRLGLALAALAHPEFLPFLLDTLKQLVDPTLLNDG